MEVFVTFDWWCISWKAIFELKLRFEILKHMSTFSYTFWPYSLFRFIQFHFMLRKKYLILKYARRILMDRKSPIQIIAKKFPSFQSGPSLHLLTFEWKGGRWQQCSFDRSDALLLIYICQISYSLLKNYVPYIPMRIHPLKANIHIHFATGRDSFQWAAYSLMKY